VPAGYRLITTTYTYYVDLSKAAAEALKRRGEGKRTEIITEKEYNEKYAGIPMQDLRPFQNFRKD
jgi:hypothetical protein